jgi:hypothetical protein
MVRRPFPASRRALETIPSPSRAKHTHASSVESDFIFFSAHAVVCFPIFICPLSQALSLYTKELDGSVKAVVAAKLGGVELDVLPVSKYTGKADAAKVRREAVSHPCFYFYFSTSSASLRVLGHRLRGDDNARATTRKMRRTRRKHPTRARHTTQNEARESNRSNLPPPPPPPPPPTHTHNAPLSPHLISPFFPSTWIHRNVLAQPHDQHTNPRHTTRNDTRHGQAPVLVVPGVAVDATGVDAIKAVAGMGSAGVYNRPSAGHVPGEVTLVDKWVAFDANTLAPPVDVVVAMLTSKAPFDQQAYDAAMKDLDGALKVGRRKSNPG